MKEPSKSPLEKYGNLAFGLVFKNAKFTLNEAISTGNFLGGISGEKISIS